MSSFVGLEKTDELSMRHPRHKDNYINYGTAGFRARADGLDHVVFRAGIMAALRSMATKATIGLMVTASHNPECDNGIKIVDPSGEMLAMSWEHYATQLANAPGSLVETLQHIVTTEKIDVSSSCCVVIAYDTRNSSMSLCQAAKDGALSFDADVQDFGLLTTPQLHYLVRCFNDNLYGLPTELGYYNKLTKAYLSINQTKDFVSYSDSITVDCANGVGAIKLQNLADDLSGCLRIEIVNDSTSGALNHNCGADYVKIRQCPPEGLQMKAGQAYASFDGDGDRLVYFYIDSDGTFHLLDGDKIATLVAKYLLKLIRQSELNLNLGIVQTAYANGSSTNFILKELGVEAACVDTGVKHLHAKAQEYDIGVYFEANGHGTVLFSTEAMKVIQNKYECENLAEKQKAGFILKHTMDLINQTVGDAMSDLLLVDTVLRHYDMSLSEWDNLYTDLPSRQLTIKVKDRSIIKTTNAGRSVLSPDGLQSEIDRVVKTTSHGRSFVRPSGTEDIVRVYAEAETQEGADDLATNVAHLVHKFMIS